jgi:hypothetical protein
MQERQEWQRAVSCVLEHNAVAYEIRNVSVDDAVTVLNRIIAGEKVFRVVAFESCEDGFLSYRSSWAEV